MFAGFVGRGYTSHKGLLTDLLMQLARSFKTMSQPYAPFPGGL